MRSRPTTLRTPAALAGVGLISGASVDDLARVAERYGVAISPAMVALIDPGDANDPIARQFVPDQAELQNAPEESADPIGDDAHSPIKGIVHRYPDRVLLKLVHVCAVYCRFCFRRETVGPGKARALNPGEIAAALDYIRARPEIWEVILSGGDPLVLSPRRLRAMTEALAGVDHVKVLRVHTRMPAVDPARVTPALARALKAGDKATYVVLHANHPRELTPAARAACARLIDAGIAMLGQSVLLRGVNDDAETLGALDARLRRVPDQAVLPASRRSCARHRAPAHRDRGRPGADAPLARALLRTLSADLRAGYSWRARQVAARAGLCARRAERSRCAALPHRRLQRPPPRLSAGSRRRPAVAQAKGCAQRPSCARNHGFSGTCARAAVRTLRRSCQR